jgi:hypothetical protein
MDRSSNMIVIVDSSNDNDDDESSIMYVTLLCTLLNLFPGHEKPAAT